MNNMFKQLFVDVDVHDVIISSYYIKKKTIRCFRVRKMKIYVRFNITNVFSKYFA